MSSSNHRTVVFFFRPKKKPRTLQILFSVSRIFRSSRCKDFSFLLSSFEIKSYSEISETCFKNGRGVISFCFEKNLLDGEWSFKRYNNLVGTKRNEFHSVESGWAFERFVIESLGHFLRYALWMLWYFHVFYRFTILQLRLSR